MLKFCNSVPEIGGTQKHAKLRIRTVSDDKGKASHEKIEEEKIKTKHKQQKQTVNIS